MHMGLWLCVCACEKTEGQGTANRKTYRDGGAKRGNKYIKTNTEREEKRETERDRERHRDVCKEV